MADEAAADESAHSSEGNHTHNNNNSSSSNNKKSLRRLCRFPGCTRVIKSQGHCQRHGAKAKRCRVDGCDKQAQGTHDGMCKRHWKAANFPDQPLEKKASEPPPPPEGESVYDSILPQSIGYRPPATKEEAAWDGISPPPENAALMPLVAFLRDGARSRQQAGWHRNAERRARGLFPVTSLSVQLEPWERQLALVEILLLSGGTPYANFKDLAFAWGREKGFHLVLASTVCERRGEVERKRRKDAGRILSDEQKESFRRKLKKTKTDDGERHEDGADEEDDEDEDQLDGHQDDDDPDDYGDDSHLPHDDDDDDDNEQGKRALQHEYDGDDQGKPDLQHDDDEPKAGTREHQHQQCVEDDDQHREEAVDESRDGIGILASSIADCAADLSTEHTAMACV